MDTSFKNIRSKLKKYVVFAQRIQKDDRIPTVSKILLAAAVAYALSPIDIIPDFIPVIGYLDDLIILPTLIFLAFFFIPKEVMTEYKQAFKTYSHPSLPARTP